jgi:hypothetical protein
MSWPTDVAAPAPGFPAAGGRRWPVRQRPDQCHAAAQTNAPVPRRLDQARVFSYLVPYSRRFA